MKTTNKIIKWNTYSFISSDRCSFSKNILSIALDNFWKSKISSIKPNHHIAILVRLELINGGIVTLADLIKLNTSNDDKRRFLRYLIDNLNHKQNGYEDLIISEITFNYAVIEGTTSTEINVNKKVAHFNYNHYKLKVVNPFDDMTKYGNIFMMGDLSKSEDEIHKLYSIQAENGSTYGITSKGNQNKLVNEVKLVKNGFTVLKFTDIANKGEDYFTRVIGSRTYTFSNEGKQLLMTQDKKIHKFIKDIKTENEFNTNFVTADIETFVNHNNNNTMIPYLLSIYDGVFHYSFFLSDFNFNASEMISNFITKLVEIAAIRKKAYNENLEIKFNKSNKENKKFNPVNLPLVIYLHNLASFDSIFILKQLISEDSENTMKIIKNKGKLIMIKVSIKQSNGSSLDLHFYDSYQILPSSLKTLAKYFNGEDGQKFEFDHTKINESNFHNYKEEAIKYCNQDCYSLFSIIERFSLLIYEKWNINISKYPTVSSLAYAIFRSNFLPKLKDVKIPQIGGDIFTHLKEGYTGGSTDMFIPVFDRDIEKKRYLEINKDRVDQINNNFHLIESNKEMALYAYDVNSLFPFCMATCELPTGPISYFEGDILERNPNAIGFFYCDVITPEWMEHPILQLHHNNRTMSPLGNFSGMFYYKEILNAKKIGYKFDIK